MPAKSIDTTVLRTALTEAIQAVKAVTDTEDGGTCNFDTIALFGRDTKAVRQVFQDLGIREPIRRNSGLWKGSWLLELGYRGQANLRTRGVYAAREALRKYADLDVCVYHQMD